MLTAPLKIYSDRTLLRKNEPHEILFYPFWGKNPEDPADPNTGRFDEYQRVGKDFFTLVNTIEEADVAVLPHQWRGFDEKTEAFCQQAAHAGKKVVIFFNHDSSEPIPVKNAVIFRTSFSQSTREAHEFSQPAWSEDFVKRYYGGNLPIREKSSRPTVSYCGYAANWKFRVKKLLRFKNLHPGTSLRTEALDRLKKCKNITANFIIRAGFWANVYRNGNSVDPSEISRVRKEFVENIAESDYVLCARGGGNFSYRLYETLSLGRIPVFINTDCVLPFEKEVPWKEMCVWVEEKDIETIAEKVLAFHQALSPEQFIELQKRNRKIWQEWLSPVGFFKNMHLLL